MILSQMVGISCSINIINQINSNATDICSHGINLIFISKFKPRFPRVLIFVHCISLMKHSLASVLYKNTSGQTSLYNMRMQCSVFGYNCIANNRETSGKSASSYLPIQHKKSEKVIFTHAMKL